ncbi:MAG: DUF4430 domain-containing protein [Ruminococcaceae bacterium]|nr:DUF4430 domain-containing protein [Oscillospiraceae bacterium]
MTNFKRILSLILCLVLIAAAALFATGCTDSGTEKETEKETETEAPKTEDSVTELGEGDKSFSFTVTDTEGKKTEFLIKTDEKTVGDALIKLELISGDEGDYGLYVKTVNGTTLDYDKDGKYWAFYINGEYGMTGVDLTEIENGASYEFKAE